MDRCGEFRGGAARRPAPGTALGAVWAGDVLGELRRWWGARGWLRVFPVALSSEPRRGDEVLRFREADLPPPGFDAVFYHHDEVTGALTAYGSAPAADAATGGRLPRPRDLASADERSAPAPPRWHHTCCCAFRVPATACADAERRFALAEAALLCARDRDDAVLDAGLSAAFDLASESGRAAEAHAKACALLAAAARPRHRPAIARAEGLLEGFLLRRLFPGEWDLLDLGALQAAEALSGGWPAGSPGRAAPFMRTPAAVGNGGLVLFGKAASAFSRLGDQFYDAASGGRPRRGVADEELCAALALALDRHAHRRWAGSGPRPSLVFAVDPADALWAGRTGPPCRACGPHCARATPVLFRGAALLTRADVDDVAESAVAAAFSELAGLVEQLAGMPCFGCVEAVAAAVASGGDALAAAGRYVSPLLTDANLRALLPRCRGALPTTAAAAPLEAGLERTVLPRHFAGRAALVTACGPSYAHATGPAVASLCEALTTALEPPPPARPLSPRRSAFCAVSAALVDAGYDLRAALGGVLPPCLSAALRRAHPNNAQRCLLASFLLGLGAFRPLVEAAGAEGGRAAAAAAAFEATWKPLFVRHEDRETRLAVLRDFRRTKYGAAMDEAIARRRRGMYCACAYAARAGACPLAAGPAAFREATDGAPLAGLFSDEGDRDAQTACGRRCARHLALVHDCQPGRPVRAPATYVFAALRAARFARRRGKNGAATQI
jgi:hypothetical protein